jgi:hypothetical protein
VKAHRFRQINISQHVTAEHYKCSIYVAFSVFHTARCAQRLVFDKVGKFDAEIVAILKIVADNSGEMVESNCDIVEAMLFQQVERMFQNGLVDNRHHGFRTIRGQRSKTRASSSSQNDSLHT